MVSPSITFLLVCFFDSFAIALILPHLNNHAKDLGLNDIQISLVSAVFTGCQLVSSPFVGSLSDVRGRKPILMSCVFVCSLTYFWLGTTSSILIFLGLRAVLGGFEQTQLLTRALTQDYIHDPSKVSVLYARFMSLGALGMASGSFISGHIMAVFPTCGFTILCFIIGGIFLANTGIIASLPETQNNKKDKSEEASVTPTIRESIMDTLKQTFNNFTTIDWLTYWDVFLFTSLVTQILGLFFSNFSLFLKTHHDVLSKTLGYIIVFQGVLGSLTNHSIVLVNKFYTNDIDYSQRMLHIFLLMIVSLTGLASASNIYIYVAFLVPKAASFALARVVTLEMVTNRSMPGNRGTLIGTAGSIRIVSDILTPLIGAFINTFLEVTCAFYTAILLATIGAMLCYRMRSRSIKEKIK